MRIVKLPGQVAPQKMGPEHRLQTFNTRLGVALLLAPYGRAADARPPGDVLDTKALGREQDDAGTLGMFERAGAVAGDRNQSC